MAVHALSTARMRTHLPQPRKAIEDEIERLIALLDAMDGNPDLEDNADDEPSIGGTYGLDLEFDESDLEPDHDNEEDCRHFPVELPLDCPASVRGLVQ